MTRLLVLLSMLAALAAAPAWTQESGTDGAPDGATEESAAPSATAIGGDLDLGQETAAPTNPNQPRQYVKETFQDWQLQCIEVPEGEDVCQMYQLLDDGQGASVAEVSIFKLADGGRAVAGGTFVVPLETLLTQKLSIAVDGGQPRVYDYSFCNQVGCYARVGFLAEDIARFKAGAVARVSLVPALAPDQTVTVEMSLSGFTAAYDAASEVRR